MINTFDYEIIGERIKIEREKLGYSQQKLAEQLDVTRQTLAKWEDGRSSPTVTDLIRLSNIFVCDPGYLLGEYEEKTRQATDIKSEIGLSQKAITKLGLLCVDGYTDALFYISDLLSNRDFLYSIDCFFLSEKYRSKGDKEQWNNQALELFSSVDSKENTHYLIPDVGEMYAVLSERYMNMAIERAKRRSLVMMRRSIRNERSGQNGNSQKA